MLKQFTPPEERLSLIKPDKDQRDIIIAGDLEEIINGPGPTTEKVREIFTIIRHERERKNYTDYGDE